MLSSYTDPCTLYGSDQEKEEKSSNSGGGGASIGQIKLCQLLAGSDVEGEQSRSF